MDLVLYSLLGKLTVGGRVVGKLDCPNKNQSTKNLKETEGKLMLY